MKCFTHGELAENQVILNGKTSAGNQAYRCKLCASEAKKRHYYKNKDKIRKKHEEYRKNNPEKVKKCKKNWEINNVEKYRQIKKDYRATHDDLTGKERKARSRKKLYDGYVRYLLCKNDPYLKAENIPSELVEIKRLNVKIVRETQGKNHGKGNPKEGHS